MKATWNLLITRRSLSKKVVCATVPTRLITVRWLNSESRISIKCLFICLNVELTSSFINFRSLIFDAMYTALASCLLFPWHGLPNSFVLFFYVWTVHVPSFLLVVLLLFLAHKYSCRPCIINWNLRCILTFSSLV